MRCVVMVGSLVGLLVGCGTRYVPVDHYHERVDVRVERDSVYFADTVRIAERGDTVLVEVVKWRTRYRSATDTVVRVDTVAIPRELVVPAPAKSWTDEWWGGFVAIALSVAVGAGSLYLLGRVFRSEWGV